MNQIDSSRYSTGDLIDQRYRVISLLGHGGMAEVYLVADTEMHDRQIALKLLYPNISLDKVNVERFIREVDLTQKLNNPHIVKSYHYKRSDKNEQYFTMEYIKGESLASHLKKRGRLAFIDVFKYLIQILKGLEAAHQGLVASCGLFVPLIRAKQGQIGLA